MRGQINPRQFLQMIMNGSNPQQMVMNVLMSRAQQNNPLISNLIQLAQNGDALGIEQIARNMSKERGIDFDKEFNNFKKQLGF